MKVFTASSGSDAVGRLRSVGMLNVRLHPESPPFNALVLRLLLPEELSPHTAAKVPIKAARRMRRVFTRSTSPEHWVCATKRRPASHNSISRQCALRQD